MLRTELVERERWITSERFNRVLAVYQALPGPEATELCCYFGMIARGRAGAVVAGLAFILPGLLLILLASWLYARYGLDNPWALAAFAGCRPAAAALICIGAYRLARRTIIRPNLLPLSTIALVAAGGHLLAAAPWAGIIGGGLFFAATSRKKLPLALLVLALTVAGIAWSATRASDPAPAVKPSPHTAIAPIAPPTPATLARTGLEAGLLTFGGAYTAIPFVHRAAVGTDAPSAPGWITHRQFLDGLAIASALPAPLVVFATFVGYLGGGFFGALIITAAIFLPAFAFTLIGHRWFERLVDEPRIHAFLDGIAAAVIGILTAAAVALALSVIPNAFAAGVFACALAAWFLAPSRFIAPLVMLAAALAGLIARALAHQ